MQVTGGMISFEDGVKKAEDYAPARKARVELRFDLEVGEDAEAIAEHVGKLTQDRVYAMLGTADAAAPKTTRARKAPDAPKAPTGKDALAAAAGLVSPTAKVVEGKTAADPAAIEDDVFTVEPDAASMEEIVVEPEPVTDADLNKAVQLKAGEFKTKGDPTGPVKIKEIIKPFNPDPSKQFMLAQIPQEQRRTFLAKLNELKP